jgi:hypothetical protein
MTRLKVFVSQPMNGKSHDDILAERTRYVKMLADMLGIPRDRIDVVNPIARGIANDDKRFSKLGYDLANPPRVWWLGQAIQEMAAADIFVFGEGYMEAKGCVIERHVQSIYFEDAPVLNLCKYNTLTMVKGSRALYKVERIWEEEHMPPANPNTIVYEFRYDPFEEEVIK